jgi:hypothetical protein
LIASDFIIFEFHQFIIEEINKKGLDIQNIKMKFTKTQLDSLKSFINWEHKEKEFDSFFFIDSNVVD